MTTPTTLSGNNSLFRQPPRLFDWDQLIARLTRSPRRRLSRYSRRILSHTALSVILTVQTTQHESRAKGDAFALLYKSRHSRSCEQ